jgi:hypothetical protein
MISPYAFRHFAPEAEFNPPVRHSLPRDSLTDDQYAICSPILLGFAFDRKSWGALLRSVHKWLLTLLWI